MLQFFLYKRAAVLNLGFKPLILFFAMLITSMFSLSSIANDMSHELGQQSLMALNKQILKNKPTGLISSKLLTINSSDLPWIDTGLNLKKGQFVSFLLEGQLDYGADVVVEPGIAFWVGFGKKAPMFTPGKNTSTTDVSEPGPLFVSRSLAEWKTPKGELETPLEYYQAVKGSIHSLVLVWESEPRKGFLELIDKGIEHPLVAVEAQRLKSPSKIPEGWRNMWLFGNSGIFQEKIELGYKRIDVFTHKDVGILQKEVDFALQPGARVDWEWIVSQLPSSKPEDTPLTHDYLSIAFEFDDGQDLTYMWSNGLPVGKHFRCPLPKWAPIETHYVIRNDQSQLGKWLSEDRDIYADYHKMIGGEAKRITRVWFIANTVFQQGFGKGSFRNINIKNKTDKVSVL